MDFKIADISNTLAANFALPGRMNLSNLAAATAVAKHFGLSDDHIAEAIKGFKPLPHRLEFISRIDGVSWYNDSISTTPASAIAALEAFNGPRIIIAGGYDKNLPFGELGEAIARLTKAAVLIGQTAEKIAKAVSSAQNDRKIVVEIADSLPQAVNYANTLAETGDVVLLSPACASYDMFENFRRRGEIFRKLVHQIKE
jgi:UDP-N-acetylmuramoylalanine--D-glutamate ligase